MSRFEAKETTGNEIELRYWDNPDVSGPYCWRIPVREAEDLVA